MSEKEFPATKEVFLYDKDTGEFISNYQAQLCPVSKDGTYLTPIYHTEKRPPSVDVNQVAVFRADANPTEGDWLVMKDFRGKTVYNQEDNTAQTMPVIGNIPSGYALTPALKFQVAQAVSEMTAKIAQWRDAARYTDVFSFVGGSRFAWQVDSISAGLIESTINLVSQEIIPCPNTWRSSDNIDVEITIADLKTIAANAAMQTQAAYQRSWDLKAALAVAVSNNDIDAIQKLTW